jgi:hypothetical protein
MRHFCEYRRDVGRQRQEASQNVMGHTQKVFADGLVEFTPPQLVAITPPGVTGDPALGMWPVTQLELDKAYHMELRNKAALWNRIRAGLKQASEHLHAVFSRYAKHAAAATGSGSLLVRSPPSVLSPPFLDPHTGQVAMPLDEFLGQLHRNHSTLLRHLTGPQLTRLWDVTSDAMRKRAYADHDAEVAAFRQRWRPYQECLKRFEALKRVRAKCVMDEHTQELNNVRLQFERRARDLRSRRYALPRTVPVTWTPGPAAGGGGGGMMNMPREQAASVALVSEDEPVQSFIARALAALRVRLSPGQAAWAFIPSGPRMREGLRVGDYDFALIPAVKLVLTHNLQPSAAGPGD